MDKLNEITNTLSSCVASDVYFVLQKVNIIGQAEAENKYNFIRGFKNNESTRQSREKDRDIERH